MIQISQKEVVEFLRSHPDEWFTRREIIEATGRAISLDQLEKMVRKGLILRKLVVEEVNYERIDGICVTQRVKKYRFAIAG